MSKVIARLRKALSANGLLTEVDVSDRVKRLFSINSILCVDVSYVDDALIPIYAKSVDVVRSVAAVASICVSIFRGFGMVLNFKPGKSEALIQWIGAKSQVCKRNVEVHRNCRIPFEHGGVSYTVNVVHCYKHLGTGLSIFSSMNTEVKTRCGSMAGEVKVIKKTVLRSACLPLGAKAVIVQSLLFSRGFYNASTWPALNTALYKKLHHTVMDIYK
eukprot:12217633-Karenia_brevis.AAC.1